MTVANNKNILIEQLKEHFDLQADPFSSLPAVFYGGAQRKHNLETLRHLVTFGDMVLLLTGEKGAGKTVLLRQFENEHGSEFNSCIIDAALTSSEENKTNNN